MNNILVIALGKSEGGCGLYAVEIIKRLSINHNVTVFKSTFSKLNWSDVNKKVKINNVITYHNKFELILSSFFIYPFVLCYIFTKLLFNKYDALYVPYFHPWECTIVRLFKLFKKKVVYTVHDGIMHYGDENKTQERMQFYSMKNSTNVVFLTEYVRDLVLAKCSTSAMIHVIPHGVFRLTGINRCKPRKKKLSILFMGRISKYKGVELLLQAISMFNTDSIEEIVIAGKSNYNIIWKKHNLLHIIDKWLTEKEIINILNDSDIMVLPYLEATQSGIATLAIDAQIPLVCTDVGGLKEQIGEAGIFVEANAKSIADGINMMLENVELFHDMQQKLRLRREVLTWDIISSKIENIFLN